MTAPKLGRPRRSSSAANRRVTIRFTDAEYAELVKAADVLPVSDWIRDVAIAAARNT